VAAPGLLERHAGLLPQPRVPPTHAEAVPAVRQVVHLGDLAGEECGVPDREDVDQRPKADPAGLLRGGGEEGHRVRRDPEALEERMLDRRVVVVAEAVGVDDLLHRLHVDLLVTLVRGIALQLAVDAETHARSLRSISPDPPAAAWRPGGSVDSRFET